MVKKLVDVHDAYKHKQQLGQLPRLWQQALYLYKAGPKNYLRVLSYMAYAHIWRDLYEVLVDLNDDVPAGDYEAVNDDIIHCIETHGLPYTGENLRAPILSPVAGWTIPRVRKFVYRRALEERARRRESQQ